MKYALPIAERKLLPILALVGAMTTTLLAEGQIAYPDLVIQDVAWSSGVHHNTSTQPIVSPSSPGLPVEVSGTADAEFVSGTSVHLTDGFHAGAFAGDGRFNARIDSWLGAPGDVVVVAPDPATYVVDHVLYVPKWEKCEVALRLPQDYQDAIDRFFAHYYSIPNSNVATPANVDMARDLNPYADDSLQVLMVLTNPAGAQIMKWGFFMREAKWTTESGTAILKEDIDHPVGPYNIHFRWAPDMEGTWHFALSINAPHTSTLGEAPLPPLSYSGYSFTCTPPLENNHGYLKVNTVNRRTLQFDDGTAYFGLGTNMADKRRIGSWDSPSNHTFYRRDMDVMKLSMEQLHEVGGNFMRMFLIRNLFAPEWENLGVYDRYHAQDPCGTVFTYSNNCQYQTWSFDQLLDHAHQNEIYLQLCIDPYPPIIDWQYLWGNHAYVRHYLENDRDGEGRYRMKGFFQTDGSDSTGVFYYWKRKYKYMLSRWGYSVNLAIVEPFNEIDQMLSYYGRDLSSQPAVCPVNRLNWPQDPELPGTYDDWLTDITSFVKGPQDLDDPAHSPLGESRTLFLGGTGLSEDPELIRPCKNPGLDLIDLHHGMYWGEDQLAGSFDISQTARDTYTSTVDGVTIKKPFHQGESNYYALVDHDGDNDPNDWYETSKVFGNYDVSFHNELWASTFFGNFATASTWHWDRVFWWPGSMPVPEYDGANSFQANFSNVLGATNYLDLGEPLPIPIQNRRLHHHFRPLADFLSNPNLQALGFFDGEFSAHKVFDPTNKLECYYLINATQTLGIGWVHNLNAYWENNFYVTKGLQNFLGCASPNAQTITLPGFLPSTDYFISYFPTRLNTSVYPDDDEDLSGSGQVTLRLDVPGPAAFNGIVNNHLDTLRSDYAFIIAPDLVKSMPVAGEAMLSNGHQDLDFSIYPNPAREELFLQLQDNVTVDVDLVDISGRVLCVWTSVAGAGVRLPLTRVAKGAYGIRITDGKRMRTKKLVIH
jgi:hypothetical protein